MSELRSAPVLETGELWVVVRAFNEGAVIDGVLIDLLAAGYRVVVVDDGSTDDTAAVAGRHGVLVARHTVNLGPGAALQTGFEAALAQGARYVATFDADGQHAVPDLTRALEPLRAGRADVVFGSRFLRDEDRMRVPPSRRILLRYAVLVNFLLTGRKLTDAHNGLRAFTADAVRRIRVRERGFAYASELLDEIRRARLRLVEVPVTITYTRHSLAKGQTNWNAIEIVLDFLFGKLLR